MLRRSLADRDRIGLDRHWAMRRRSSPAGSPGGLGGGIEVFTAFIDRAMDTVGDLVRNSTGDLLEAGSLEPGLVFALESAPAIQPT